MTHYYKVLLWYIYNYSIIHSGFTVQILYEHKFSPHLGKYLGMQLLDGKVRVCFKFVKKLPNCLPKWFYHFAFIPVMNGSCLISLLTFDVSILDFSYSNSCEFVKWRRKWQPTPTILAWRIPWQRNLVGYSPWASLVAQMIKHLSAMRETWVQSLGWKDPLEKEVATHSSTLAWRIPWMEEPGRLQSMG